MLGKVGKSGVADQITRLDLGTLTRYTRDVVVKQKAFVPNDLGAPVERPAPSASGYEKHFIFKWLV